MTATAQRRRVYYALRRRPDEPNQDPLRQPAAAGSWCGRQLPDYRLREAAYGCRLCPKYWREPPRPAASPLPAPVYPPAEETRMTTPAESPHTLQLLRLVKASIDDGYRHQQAAPPPDGLAKALAIAGIIKD